jgi:MscS family membrane protein
MILAATFLGNTLRNWLFFLLFVFIGFFISRVFLIVSKTSLTKLSNKTKSKFDDIVVNIMTKPLPFVLLIIVIFVDIGLDQLTINSTFLNIFSNILFLLYVFCISWFVAKLLLGIIEEYITKLAKKTKTKADDQLVPILKTLSQILVIIFAGLIVLSHFGQDVGALVAGLGIGGLAVALAAKDALANLISGVVLFTEKHFNIGDVFKINNESGVIKEIGLRSTKIQKFDGTLMIIPNTSITNTSIENISFRKSRREDFTLALTYDTTVAKLNKGKKIIKDILSKNKDVSPDFYIRFEEFADFSLNIKVTYYITELDWGKYLIIKDNINTNIKKEFEKAKIDFAFPTQTIELKK